MLVTVAAPSLFLLVVKGEMSFLRGTRIFTFRTPDVSPSPCGHIEPTGESLEGVSLAEQWRRAHELARGWRTYTDGRPGKQTVPPAEGKGKKLMPHIGRGKCRCTTVLMRMCSTALTTIDMCYSCAEMCNAF